MLNFDASELPSSGFQISNQNTDTLETPGFQKVVQKQQQIFWYHPT
jgi:hypothetical protein